MAKGRGNRDSGHSQRIATQYHVPRRVAERSPGARAPVGKDAPPLYPHRARRPRTCSSVPLRPHPGSHHLPRTLDSQPEPTGAGVVCHHATHDGRPWCGRRPGVVGPDADTPRRRATSVSLAYEHPGPRVEVIAVASAAAAPPPDGRSHLPTSDGSRRSSTLPCLLPGTAPESPWGGCSGRCSALRSGWAPDPRRPFRHGGGSSNSSSSCSSHGQSRDRQHRGTRGGRLVRRRAAGLAVEISIPPAPSYSLIGVSNRRATAGRQCRGGSRLCAQPLRQFRAAASSGGPPDAGAGGGGAARIRRSAIPG